MDKEKEIKLRDYYKSIPDQQLLDFLSDDENNFEEGAYALLIEEANRRGLEDKLNAIKAEKEESKRDKEEPAYTFVKVFSTPNLGDISIIKSLLESEKIEYFIKGENFGIIYGPADGLSSADVMVREDQVEEAGVLLKDFISPIPLEKGNREVCSEAPVISKPKPFFKINIILVLIGLCIFIGFVTIRNYSARTIFNQGCLHIRNGQYDDAIEDFSKVIKINHKFAAAYVNRGLAYQLNGNLLQAVLDFSEAIKIMPNHAKAYYWRGNVYSHKENYGQAIADYNKTIELEPNYAEAYGGRAYAYYKKGDYDQAISDDNMAIELKLDNALVYASVYNTRGFVYFLKGNFNQAISDYAKAIEFNPRLAFAYYNRGLAYYCTEQYDGALKDYTEAIKLGPDKESYDEFLKYVPEKKFTDVKNIREEILKLFKKKITVE